LDEADGQSARVESDSPAPLVAFDFDGTLTWRDSLRAFLAWRTGAPRYALAMASLAPAAARYLVDRDRGRLKGAMIGAFLAGAPRTRLEAEARAFAERAGRLLRPDAVECWNRWRQAGARLVIVTASPEILVAPFARELGAATLIGTRLAFDDHDRLAGMDGANCRGAEKVRRIREAFGRDARLAAAYGDSDGDLEMLKLADEAGYRVFGGRP
jgi:phosphatidylglycerophosphatase C